MRFLCFTQYFYPEVGASQVVMASIIHELIRQGHDVELVTAMPNHPTGAIFPAYRGKWYVREEWEGVPVHRIWLCAANDSTLKRMVNYLSFACTAPFALRRAQKPDYLFLDSPPLTNSIPAVLAARRWGVPLIVNVSDLWPDSVRDLGVLRDGAILRAAERLEAWTYTNASYLDAVTDGIYTTLIEKKGVPAEKVLHLPNGVDIETFKPAPRDDALARELGLVDTPVLLYAGTHGHAHGMDVALAAAALLTDTPIQFIFIGNGPKRQALIELAQARRLPNVRFLEPEPLAFVARLHTLAFAGLSTLSNNPLFEGTRPVKALVAMAAGKPVIYSGAGEGARIITDAKAGLVTPPEDGAALAAAIRRLWEHPAEAREMGANGRAYIERHLSWQTLVREWLADLTARESQRAAKQQ